MYDRRSWVTRSGDRTRVFIDTNASHSTLPSCPFFLRVKVPTQPSLPASFLFKVPVGELGGLPDAMFVCQKLVDSVWNNSCFYWLMWSGPIVIIVLLEKQWAQVYHFLRTNQIICGKFAKKGKNCLYLIKLTVQHHFSCENKRNVLRLFFYMSGFTKENERQFSYWGPLWLRRGTFVLCLNFKSFCFRSRIESKPMSLSVFVNCACAFLPCCLTFNPSVCRLWPFQFSYVALLRPCLLTEFYADMASKSILTFSWIIFEVELFELRGLEPGYNHLLLFCFVLFCFVSWVGHFFTLKMGGSSFILAKGRVCWSPLQPWGAMMTLNTAM